MKGHRSEGTLLSRIVGPQDYRFLDDKGSRVIGLKVWASEPVAL
jgi:hypothetical protein